jgi:Ribonuclease G/E
MLIAVSLRAATARIALLDGDTLREYALWHLEKPDGVGDIYTGRVTSHVHAMAGFFIELGDATGFLPESAAPKNLSEGSYLSVRITRAAQSGKGPRLAAADSPAADKPGLIQRGPGPLLELASRLPAAPVSIDDYALIATLRPALGERMRYDASRFDAVLEDEIASLHEPSVALPGGAVMHITPTPALTAIDIDSSQATAANAAKPQAQLALNTAIIPAIARQILLRNLSGAILIDFAGMKPKTRETLTAPLAAVLQIDPLKPQFLGFTKLGFAEILRPRIRPPLHEVLTP